MGNPLEGSSQQDSVDVKSIESVFLLDHMEMETATGGDSPANIFEEETPKRRRRKGMMNDEEIAKKWQDVQLDEVLRDVDSDSDSESVQKSDGKKPYNKDRLRIIQAASELRNWRQLAVDLGVPRSTATRWVTCVGQLENLPRGGSKRKKQVDSRPKRRKGSRKFIDAEIAKKWKDVQLDEIIQDMDSDNDSENGQKSDGKKSYNKDRVKIIQAAKEHRNWRQLAADLGVPRSTATRWVTCVGQLENLPRGGNTRSKLEDSHIEYVLQRLRQDQLITIQDLALSIRREFGIVVTANSISNNLYGKVIIADSVQADPEEINSLETRSKRRDYVRRMVQFTAVGKRSELFSLIKHLIDCNFILEKHIIYIDELNVHMLSRRQATDSRSPDVVRSNSRWPNIRLIVAVSTRGVEKMTPKRGSYDVEAANDWLRNLICEQAVQISVKNIAIVCDSAPCYLRFPEICKELGVEHLKRPPHSCVLNPMEYLWPRVKSAVISAPSRTSNESLEEKLDAMEEIMVDAGKTIRPIECIEAVVHACNFFRRAENLENVPAEIAVESIIAYPETQDT